MMTPTPPQQPSLPPVSQPPYDPAVEKLRLIRGIVIDLAVVGAVVAFVVTKAVDGAGGLVLLAAIAGAGVVHKGGSGIASKVGGSAAVALVAGVVGKGSDS